jgi:hypothetical protein
LPEPERTGGQEVGIMQAISERVFVLMHRNAMRATDFFKIPDDRTVEFGLRVSTTALTREEQLERQRQRAEALAQTDVHADNSATSPKAGETA